MFRATLGALLFLAAGPAPQQEKDPLITAFDAWWKEYPKGHVDIHDPRQAAAAIHAQDMLRRLAGYHDAASAERLLAVLTLSQRLDPGNDRPGPMPRPWVVVAAAEKAIAAVRAPNALQVFAGHLEKSIEDRRTRSTHRPTEAERVQLAGAIRALALARSSAHWPLIAACLDDSSFRVRRAAAEALGAVAPPLGVDPLTRALIGEADETARIAEVDALRRLLKGRTDVDPRAARAVVRAACNAFNLGTWRGDLALATLLREVRSVEAIPVLIKQLERCIRRIDERGETLTEEHEALSGTLLSAVHTALVDLTGFSAPPHLLGDWRAWWAKNKDGFVLPPSIEARAAAADSRVAPGQRTTAEGFFGIEVTGSRITFVVDISRSMSFAFGTSTDEPAGGGTMRRIDEARRELVKAIQGLPPDARFNIITFAANATAWKRELVPASAANKREAVEFTTQLKLEPATNLFAALDRALGIRSADPGDRLVQDIDELIVLSDGAPTAGAVVATDEILRLVDHANRYARVRINTVFLGPREPMGEDRATGALTPYEMMERLAKDNGGKFVAR